ncbi:hypothetical protein BS50DRAFT_521051, partial [Corynespora cassiicola Philippines]
MPEDECVPMYSVIRRQKQQAGFFKHPLLVVKVEGPIVHFYSMTSKPPKAIAELGYYFHIAYSHHDTRDRVLRLAKGASPMHGPTIVNLECRYWIEWCYINEWAGNTEIDDCDMLKLHLKIEEMEAAQNRYIYKPLLRNMIDFPIGSIIMIQNPEKSSTIGSPILITGKDKDRVYFLRIKDMNKVPDINVFGQKWVAPISKEPGETSKGEPFVVLDEKSPNMRESS